MNLRPAVNVVLIAPEIPQNTGNIIRLCANVGARLHLVEPISFELKNPGLRRASLDYNDLTDVQVYNSLDDLLESRYIGRIFAATTSGATLYTTPRYEVGDTIMFGSESVGLPENVLDLFEVENRLRIPMMPGNRSLNLSNATAIVVYEMWRQIQFHGATSLTEKDECYFV